MSGAARPSKATRAIGYATDADARVWHTPDGEPYADIRGEHGERCTLRVRSRAFRTWLSGLMYRSEGNALGGQSATDAVDVLSAMAMAGDERKVHVRLAEHEGCMYLDLGDDTWKAVEIDRDGWRLVDQPPVRFRRPRGLRPLPEPTRAGGGWEALRALLHLHRGNDDKDWILLVAWIVGAMHPHGPYPVLAFTGEHGTAKTTTGKLCRVLVDPSAAPLRSPPRDDRDLVVEARNAHVLALDNLSRIPDWLSDGLCRIATGGGYSARELYTDGEIVVYSDCRPIILTSIEDVATRGDLADRTIVVELPRMPEHVRRREAAVIADLERLRPALLGGLLDAVACGLRRRDRVHLEKLPRMADFAAWVVACEPALPWRAGAFVDAYAGARKATVEASIQADAVAVAIIDLVGDCPSESWSGTATELLGALDARRDGKRPPKDWPETPQAMGGRLRRAAPLLRAAGWSVERGEGRDQWTNYLKRSEAVETPNDAHDADEPNDSTGPEREDGREHGEESPPTPHRTPHPETPSRTTDVRTREDSKESVHTRTVPGERGAPTPPSNGTGRRRTDGIDYERLATKRLEAR